MHSIFSLIRRDFHSYLKLHKNPNILTAVLAFFHNPGMFFSLIYRFERGLIYSNNQFINIIGWFFLPFYFMVTYFILDFQIDVHTSLGPGLYLHNRGIIIASGVKSGRNLMVLGPVTIGSALDDGKSSPHSQSPHIGDNVIVCTGARVIGGINVGNNVIIGANAAVIRDVPDDSLAVGVPARCKPKRAVDQI